jgi:hypothetical protein
MNKEMNYKLGAASILSLVIASFSIGVAAGYALRWVVS